MPEYRAGEVFMASRRCWPFTHRWVRIEAIGNIKTYVCARCKITKTRVR